MEAGSVGRPTRAVDKEIVKVVQVRKLHLNCSPVQWLSVVILCTQ
jgi:hypothetical protein